MTPLSLEVHGGRLICIVAKLTLLVVLQRDEQMQIVVYSYDLKINTYRTAYEKKPGIKASIISFTTKKHQSAEKREQRNEYFHHCN